jgi:hypothetical protein
MRKPPVPEPPPPAVPPVPEPPPTPTELPPLPLTELPPLPLTELPPLPPPELPPVLPVMLPPEPVLPPPDPPSSQVLMQLLKLAQSAMPRHALRSDCAALGLDCSDSLNMFLHWATLVPERALQVSALSQICPAMLLPLPLVQPAASTASSPTAIIVHRVLGIVDSS